jgi:uncharacterized protein (DUF2141 family)
LPSKRALQEQKQEKEEAMDAKKIIAVLFLILPVLSSVPAEGFTVGGEISFTKTGDLFIQLATEEEFNNDRMPPFALILRVGPEEMKKGKVSFQFGKVPVGTYGIRCFQDVNENQKLDRGVFGPSEPWGVYRPKRPAFRGPKFEEISFVLDRDMVDVQVEVK